MKWAEIYTTLINKAQSENRVKGSSVYYENHHIIPKHMGGLNTVDNLVLLTFREHYLAHYLLWKIHNKKQDKIVYLMRSNQREDAQKLRIESAVHSNRNGGMGFLNFTNNNPMKKLDSRNRALSTKKEKYGNRSICSDQQYHNIVKALNRINSDPIIIEKRKTTLKNNISKLTDAEKKKRFSRFSEKNGNYGWIKGRYKAITPAGEILLYESQTQIITELGVSQSTLVRLRNTGLINCKSLNPKLRKWNNWQFIYYKNPHPKTGKLLSKYKKK